MTKKKKEHYVPRCYLEKWCIPGSKQVNVFDKQKDESRINHIEDVASERFFYDLNLEGVFSKEEIKFYKLEDVDLSQVDNEQYIENYFADNIEGVFKTSLEQIIFRVRKMNAWEIKNCFFIKPESTFSFAILLALQYIRVKRVRNSIEELSNLLEQALKDQNASNTIIDGYTSVSKNQLKYIHGKMIFDKDAILRLATTFSEHIWILLKNNTAQPFFTSDNPIGITGHIHNPYTSAAGVSSK